MLDAKLLKELFAFKVLNNNSCCYTNDTIRFLVIRKYYFIAINCLFLNFISFVYFIFKVK